MHRRALCLELINELRLVFFKAVGKDIDCLAASLAVHDVGEEREEFCRGLSSRCLARYFAGLGVERCEQRDRAMPVELVAVALGSTGARACSPSQSKHFGIGVLHCDLRGLDEIDTVNISVN